MCEELLAPKWLQCCMLQKKGDEKLKWYMNESAQSIVCALYKNSPLLLLLILVVLYCGCFGTFGCILWLPLVLVVLYCGCVGTCSVILWGQSQMCGR